MCPNCSEARSCNVSRSVEGRGCPARRVRMPGRRSRPIGAEKRQCGPGGPGTFLRAELLFFSLNAIRMSANRRQTGRPARPGGQWCRVRRDITRPVTLSGRRPTGRWAILDPQPEDGTDSAGSARPDGSEKIARGLIARKQSATQGICPVRGHSRQCSPVFQAQLSAAARKPLWPCVARSSQSADQQHWRTRRPAVRRLVRQRRRLTATGSLACRAWPPLSYRRAKGGLHREQPMAPSRRSDPAVTYPSLPSHVACGGPLQPAALRPRR